MKAHIGRLALGAMALTALTSSQVAQAQQCVSQQDMADAVIYFVPVLGNAFKAQCANRLSPTGFMATQGDAMIAQYEPLRADRFPAALRILDQFGNEGKEADVNLEAMASEIGPEAMQPFVDGIVANELVKEIKTEDCSDIERGISLVAPLPPENVGALVTFILDMSGVKEPTICSYSAAE